MIISNLVDFVQKTYPPAGGFPKPREGDRGVDYPDELAFDDLTLPLNLPEIDRAPLPPWLIPGQAERIEQEVVPWIEEPSTPTLQQRPANPDVLAYYLPFHFYRTSWGIYVRASGVKAIASMLASASGRPIGELSELAYQILLEHERFHFFTEVACSRAEVSARSPLYSLYFAHRRAAALEEALANAHSIRAALRDQPAVVRSATEAWMRGQGAGYRDFSRWLTRSSFLRGRRVSTSVMVGYVSGSGSLGPTEFLYDGVSRFPVPTFMLHDVAAVRTFKPFPKYLGIRIVVHTNDHPPPHVHLQNSAGYHIARLHWPNLEPLKGERPLSSSERSTLTSYLERYGSDVSERVQRVYGVGV
jgi:hypothetical protein